MKKILVAALAFSAAASYADTSSFSGFYVGGGVSSVRNDLDDTKWSPAELFGGYKLNPFVGGEVRVGASFEGDTKITNYESVYYRTESANSVGKSYLLLGYSHAVIETFSGDYTLNGMSYGAGVGFVISEKFNLNLEYKVLANGKGGKTKDQEEDIKLSSVSATVDYRF